MLIHTIACKDDIADLREAFRAIDTDENGFITAEELADAMVEQAGKGNVSAVRVLWTFQ